MTTSIISIISAIGLTALGGAGLYAAYKWVVKRPSGKKIRVKTRRASKQERKKAKKIGKKILKGSWKLLYSTPRGVYYVAPRIWRGTKKSAKTITGSSKKVFKKSYKTLKNIFSSLKKINFNKLKKIVKKKKSKEALEETQKLKKEINELKNKPFEKKSAEVENISNELGGLSRGLENVKSSLEKKDSDAQAVLEEIKKVEDSKETFEKNLKKAIERINELDELGVESEEEREMEEEQEELGRKTERLLGYYEGRRGELEETSFVIKPDERIRDYVLRVKKDFGKLFFPLVFIDPSDNEKKFREEEFRYSVEGFSLLNVDSEDFIEIASELATSLVNSIVGLISSEEIMKSKIKELQENLNKLRKFVNENEGGVNNKENVLNNLQQLITFLKPYADISFKKIYLGGATLSYKKQLRDVVKLISDYGSSEETSSKNYKEDIRYELKKVYKHFLEVQRTYLGLKHWAEKNLSWFETLANSFKNNAVFMSGEKEISEKEPKKEASDKVKEEVSTLIEQIITQLNEIKFYDGSVQDYRKLLEHVKEGRGGITANTLDDVKNNIIRPIDVLGGFYYGYNFKSLLRLNIKTLPEKSEEYIKEFINQLQEKVIKGMLKKDVELITEVITKNPLINKKIKKSVNELKEIALNALKGYEKYLSSCDIPLYKKRKLIYLDNKNLSKLIGINYKKKSFFPKTHKILSEWFRKEAQVNKKNT